MLVKENPQYYIVDFEYSQMGNTFSSGARLTESEREKLLDLLERYKRAGAILPGFSVEVYREVEQDYDGVVIEITTALRFRTVSIEVVEGKCQNCQHIWPADVMIPRSEIKDLLQRVAPGEPMPNGECPSCGALCQPV